MFGKLKSVERGYLQNTRLHTCRTRRIVKGCRKDITQYRMSSGRSVMVMMTDAPNALRISCIRIRESTTAITLSQFEHFHTFDRVACITCSLPGSILIDTFSKRVAVLKRPHVFLLYPAVSFLVLVLYPRSFSMASFVFNISAGKAPTSRGPPSRGNAAPPRSVGAVVGQGPLINPNSAGMSLHHHCLARRSYCERLADCLLGKV